MSTHREIQIMRREQSERWIVPPMPYTQNAIIRVIGGNLQNGVPTIKYITDGSFTVTAVYDPNVDTVYDDGLGYGDIVLPGIIATRRVLVRHNYGGFPDSLMGGNCYMLGGFSTITYSGTAMAVALIGRG